MKYVVNTYVESKTVTHIHCGVYKFINPQALSSSINDYRGHEYKEVSTIYCKSLKFVDPVVYAYNIIYT